AFEGDLLSITLKSNRKYADTINKTSMNLLVHWNSWLDGWPTFGLYHHNRVPHLRDGFIVDKVGHFRGSENPDTLQTLKTDRAAHDSHLRRDETAPKMGHPIPTR